MKTIKFIIVASILASLLFACNQKPDVIDKADDLIKTIGKVDPPTSKPELISKDTFYAWKARWNNNFRKYMANDSMNYFNMPLVDLKDILKESPVDSARFYMGMDTLKHPHLMLVGTHNGIPNLTVIADYTRVCPPFCDKK